MHEFAAVLEPVETPSPERRDELGYRLRQQSLLGEFGRTAMQTRDLREILQRATELCATGLQAAFAKVLEYEPAGKRLMVRAGVGWAPGTIDAVSVAADIGSPAGYAYRTGVPIISNHLEADTRFRTPRLLAAYGIRRAINVLIERGGEGKAFFGVLEVDSADPGQFDRDDANFLAGFAGLLGIAIERQQADARLEEALKHQALLTREMSHRVKNSLTSVVGLLRVQARSAQSEDVKNALQDASLRVSTIAEVHDHLWRSSHIGYVELADFMTELCKKLRGSTGKHTLHCHADRMLLGADHAVPLGLLINELVTNAVKYAYPEGSGDIEVSAREMNGHLHVEVSDHGTGLPEGFDIDQPRASLGFKVVTGMVRQLQGHLTLSNNQTGTRFLLDLPILSHLHESSSA
ncbi:GAF domain-containing protein [Bradyrhizobium sp. AUGA SZCCT0240]|uniref:sensor histidine kinase n=1 Tax=unclassified Bradyrhizobium TaxID=2631580 RepID=UPI001BA9F6BC|nr:MULTISPECIES: histidine kinase dimerization/phosphoacceptor domain -containing protein [unclassified Bradyrhizobium]MBR1196595.1 GAF domain-containing protein [Bradyrhizobium sp. AUGA SZCCT0158]MBR1242343.1 GAF domain-containing protein [Bradyrhizobium sp. AUGA SZCCT0274]MBR1257122.1 GAF domain-containing protein [Bradyrhizobium sp. AUGA SZCCT0240]